MVTQMIRIIILTERLTRQVSIDVWSLREKNQDNRSRSIPLIHHNSSLE